MKIRLARIVPQQSFYVINTEYSIVCVPVFGNMPRFKSRLDWFFLDLIAHAMEDEIN
jgi:hypothetical protein